MNIILEFASDAEGNKYFNLSENPQYDNKKIGNRLIDYEILQVLSNEEADKYFVAKVRSLNTNNLYSMKKMDLSNCQNNDKNYIDEVMKKLKDLNNPHIIKYYNHFIENNNLYIIMEFMNNSDIRGFIKAHQVFNKPIREEEIWNILLQCLSALNYVQEKNLGSLGIRLNNIFMNNEQNAKIGVFRELICGKGNYNPREDIYTLGKFFYVIMNSQKIKSEDIMKPEYIYKIEYEEVQNNFYSKELRDIIGIMSIKSKTNVDAISLYTTVKDEYVKKYAKNTSIEAVLRCLASYTKLNDCMNSLSYTINKEKEKYYINYWYNQAINTILGLGEEQLPLNTSIEEFRRAIASSYSKLDGNKEIDPLLLLTFLLVMMQKETNKEKKDSEVIQNKDKNEKMTNYVISSSFSGEEEDKTNKLQMWNKYITNFNETVNSPISDLFFGFVKRKILCQTCRSGFYSFYHYLYIIFDLSQRKDDQNFDIIKDGFKERHKNYRVIDANDSNKILCDRCSTYQTFKEFNRYYMLKDQLIICFIRGNNYKNKSKIIFEEKIDLTEFIEPDINSPHYFYLVGTVIRSFKDKNEQFLSYSRDTFNEYTWHCPRGELDISSKENKNYFPLNDIKKDEEKGQIIMLFYKSTDNQS